MDDALPLVVGGKNDAVVTVRYSEDKLSAWGDFYPAEKDGKPLDPRRVANALSNQGVSFGILFDNIQTAAMDCNLKRTIIKGIPLAQGIAPVEERPEYYEVNPGLGRVVRASPLGNARVDHRAISPFVIVKKGQPLARLRPKKAGKDGTDIYGTPITHGASNPQGVTAGPNTRADGKFICAEIAGQYIHEKGQVRVQDTLEIKGNVNYRTGNIIFPGDVLITGAVSHGFKVYSGGSITIKQTFDVTEAAAKGDLDVAGGIAGREKAAIKVGGEIRAKFIENCHVACRKTIRIETDIANSEVYTLDRVEMGEKGVVFGSDIYAVNGLKTCGIGKKFGKGTSIHCGVDFTIMQEKDKLTDHLGTINTKIGKLRLRLEAELKAIPNPAPASPAFRLRVKLAEALKVLEAEQKKASEALGAVMGRVNTNESAEVEVTGTIMPGTLIEICQVALFITDPVEHVRISLDKAANKLVSKPLPPGQGASKRGGTIAGETGWRGRPD